MPTWYHYEGSPCPECGEKILMFSLDSGTVRLECDDMGAPGCGNDFGAVGEAENISEAQEEVEDFLHRYEGERMASIRSKIHTIVGRGSGGT